MLTSIRRANENKMPIYAECGGYMYLMQGIFDFDSNFHAMAGIIPATAKMNKKLQTVGYVKAKNLHDNILGEKDCVYHGHEFHFSTQSEEAQDFPWAFEFVKMRNNAEYKAGYAKDNILGSYLHLHFLGSKKAADCLLEKAREYYKNRTKG